MQEKVSVVVYTPANMNAIDGSSVWTQSITLALAAVPRVEVTLLLSHPVTNDRLMGPLQRDPAVSIVEPSARQQDGNGSMTPDQTTRAITRMKRNPPRAVVVRGRVAANRLAMEPALQGMLWPYLTDIPQRPAEVTTEARETLKTIMAASPVLLCQTEELGLFLEEQFPVTTGKTFILPPAIPEGLTPHILPAPAETDLRLCYSGKFARQWNTYEMCELPAELAKRGIDASLTMVGDKVNQDAAWPEFITEMRRKLETTPGVEWVGGVSREQSIDHMAAAHIGLSWRSPELDDSLELSTKLLEYCAVGTPPILNRTTMHERVFGKDYPLFVDAETPVVDLIEATVRDPVVYETALDQISKIPSEYTMDKAGDRLAHLADSLFPTDGSYPPKPGLMRRLGSRLSIGKD